ncbi:MAG: PKD domain-containing protein [Bacteroidia bacterium]|nr:PKD domain-containing protein [Bacteroidia bacterium]
MLLAAVWILPGLQAQPAGFTDQLYLGGWNGAVGLTFDENGVMYVWEKGGRVYIVQNGVKRAAPLINISDEIGDWRDFGMLGVALDPNYLVNGYIYLYYVVDRHHLRFAGTPQYNPNANEYFNATIGRITRYQVQNPANYATAVADYNTRFVLLGETASTGVPILHESHGTGALIFGTDGTLLASSGDGASYNTVDAGSSGDTYFAQALTDGIINTAQNVGAFRSQMLSSLNGKMLRLDPATGNGVPSNPYYNPAAPRSAQSRTYALGLRNPYRFTIKPETGSHFAGDGDPGVIYLGDVGWGTREDMHVITQPGTNCGWPLFEGMDSNGGYAGANPYNQEAPTPSGCSQPFYRFADLLKQDPGNGVQPSFPDPCNPGQQINGSVYKLWKHSLPAYDWRGNSRVSVNGVVYNVGSGPVPGPQWGGNASTGGVWYTGTEFPAEYQNTYFHADYGGGWIKYFKFGANDQPLSAHNFDPSNGAVVFIGSDPYNGGLYYIAYGGEVRRFVYSPSGNQPPVAAASATPVYGPSPLNVAFSSAGSSDPESGPLTYLWDFGDGAFSSQANPSHTYLTANSNPAQYNVVLTVTDNQNQTATKTLIVSANNTPPVIVSTSLDNVSEYSITAPTTLSISAVVTDAEHGPNQLTYGWQTVLHHSNHTHPEPIDNNPVSTTQLSPVGCDGAVYFYRIYLTVTDAAGLSTTVYKDILPNCGAPQAIDDEALYTNGGTTVVDILGNDLSNPALDPASVVIVDQPLHGTLSVNPATGAVTYIHDGLGAISDQFTYTVENTDNELSNLATVHLNLLGPPTVNILSPIANAQIGGSSVLVEYSASGDLSGVDHVELTLDAGTPVELNDLNGIYTFTGVAPGPHTVTAKLLDGSHTPLGNPEATDNVSFSVLAFSLVGNAFTSGGCIAVTTTAANQAGAAWYNTQADFSNSFDLVFSVNFGNQDGNGADGMGFVFQTLNVNALGAPGGGLGFAGLAPSFAVEFDGYDNGSAEDLADDHIAIVGGGNLASPVVAAVCATASCANIEDGADHTVRFTWNPATQVFSVYFDGALRSSYTGNIPANFLGGSSLAYFGWTGGTGGLTNLQTFCVTSLDLGGGPASQTISFDAISGKLTTDAPFTVNATATSGLPVSFSIVSGPATVSGNTVTLTGTAGTVIVRASQAGNAQFSPAPDVDRTFEVGEPQLFTTAGSATAGAGNCYTLTTEQANIAGAAWSASQLTLAQPFDLKFTFNMGGNDGGGADGMAFVLRSAGAATVGATGGGLGVAGIFPSFGAEFDGYDNNSSTGGNSPEDIAADHVAIFANGDLPNPLAAAACLNAACDNFEDGQNHDARFTWDPVTQVFNVYVDNVLRNSYTGDIAANLFGGNPAVYFGWTAATGGLTNTQSFCATELNYSVPKLDQTISFDAIPNKATTDAPFTVNATATSGLPVSFSIVNGPATVSGNTVTLTGVAGTVTVRASQAGNGQYNAAPDADRTFTVNEPAFFSFATVGNAAFGAASECYVLTTESSSFQTGAVWNQTQLDLGAAFDLNFTVSFGANDGNGADGMAFVLQGTGTAAIGATGGGFGAAGLTPSFGVEFDGYDNGSSEDIADDHVAIFGGGDLLNPVVPAVCTSPSCANLEDGADHAVQITWDPATQVFSVFVDGSLRINYTGDIAASFFGGNAGVYFGWTAATGGFLNTQTVCMGTLTYSEPLLSQTISFDAIPNKLTTDAPFTVNATATSGLPVSFSIVSGPATVSGNTVTLTGAPGEVTVRASQAGDAQYSAAPDADRSFTVAAPGLYTTAGSAAGTGNECYTITPDQANVAGAVWYSSAISLSQGFDLNFTLNLGGKDADGADGAAFVLQQAGTSAVGANGGGLGVVGVFPSFGVEFDVYDNNNSTGGNSPEDIAADHVAIFANGDLVNPLAPAACMSGGCTNFEDGQDHDVRITWNPASQTFDVYVDNDLRISYTGDVINTIFGGNANVYFGWTGGTGGLTNLQTFCSGTLTFTAPPQSQTISFDPIPNKQTTDAPFTVNATATSGLPVSFSIVSGPATVSGNTVTLTGAVGTVTVRASQAGDAQYAPAADVEQSFTVVADPGNYSPVGSAYATGNDCFVLTPDEFQQTGAVWNNSLIDLAASFDFQFTVNLGTNDADGADGIAFLLQNSGLSTLGGPGSGLGAFGVVPSVGVEIDLFDSSPFLYPELADDHVAIFTNGDLANRASDVCAATTCANIEDGLDHTVQIVWDAATTTLSVYFDGVFRTSYTGDVVNTIFGGNSQVYFGWTGATGGSKNQHTVCVDALNFGTIPPQNQTIAFDAIPNKLTTDAPFAVNAAATSGLPASFSIVSGPATVSGNTVTLTGGPGTVTVRASQAGNAGFNPAADVDRSFEVIDAAAFQFVTAGSASLNTSLDCYTITADAENLVGAVWSKHELNLASPFDLNFTVNLGSNDATGADGISFALQNSGTGALGAFGGGLGTAGISPSLIVEIDTWDNTNGVDIADDHMAIALNGNLDAPVAPAICADPACANIEDGADHAVRFTWNPATQLFEAYFDGSLRVSYTGNLIGLFGGNPLVRFGFGGGTGGSTNLQTVCAGSLSYTSGPVGQTIDFPPLADKIEGDAPFTVSATASSGLPVSFSIVSGPATVSGSTVTLTGTGTVTVRASQAGNAGFSAAADVDRSFEVVDCLTAGTCSPCNADITNISIKQNVKGVLQTGNRIYVDNTVINYTSVPGDLAGATTLRTSNSGRAKTSASYLSFTLTQAATIYVAYDARAASQPNWLKTQFTLTSYTIGGTENTYNVWAKTFPAGTVALGGNRASGYSSSVAVNMYFVVLGDCDGSGPPPPANLSPVAAFTATPASGTAPLTVSFNAAASNDPDGSIQTYAWSFGDGSTGSGVTESHTYNSAGSFTVTLTVTDDDGATDTETATVTVNPPVGGGGCTLITSVTPLISTTGIYEIDCPAAVGEVVYTGRNTTITSLPAALGGADFVRTAFGDRNRSTGSMLSIGLSQAATVYVAYDSRATVVPSWLGLWTNTGTQIVTTDAPMNVYSRAYSAGSFTLPGNKSGGGNALANYFVLAKPALGSRPAQSGSAFASVYPNPFTDYIEVNLLDPDVQTVDVRILNALGQVVFEQRGLPTQPTLRVGRELAEGMYHLEVSYGSLVNTFNVLKLK